MLKVAETPDSMDESPENPQNCYLSLTLVILPFNLGGGTRQLIVPGTH
jgi:hypothetical protein